MISFLRNWIHHLLDPHCEHCLDIDRQKREIDRAFTICESCETLKHQLEIANQVNMQLVDKITHIPAEPKVIESEERPRAVGKRFIPHAVRREMMLREDQNTAVLMANKLKEMKNAGVNTDKVVSIVTPTSEVSEEELKEINELEKEMGLAAEVRENQKAESNAS